jgi:hypothetical protein
MTTPRLNCYVKGMPLPQLPFTLLQYCLIMAAGDSRNMLICDKRMNVTAFTVLYCLIMAAGDSRNMLICDKCMNVRAFTVLY